MITGTELLEALPVAVYTTDADGRITFYNEAAADLWGHHPELGSSQWCGSWRLYWPDGRPLPRDGAERASIGNLADADERRTQLALVMEGEQRSKGQRSKRIRIR